MRAVAEGASLAGAARVVALLLAGYLILGQPVVGAWSARRQHRDPERGARLRRYRRTSVLEWSLVAVALGLVLAAPGLDLGDLGLRWPRASAYTLVGGLGLLASLGLLVGLRRRVDRGVDVVAPPEVGALLPRSAAERRAFAGLALTAGSCEEVLYRGLLLAVAAAVAPELGPWRLVLVSGLAFAVAHTYQGVTGMLTAGVLGGAFAVLFLGSGSLLLPVLYHVLIDLRLLLLGVGTPRHRRPGVAPRPAVRAAHRPRTGAARLPAGPDGFTARQPPGVSRRRPPPPGTRAGSPRGPA